MGHGPFCKCEHCDDVKRSEAARVPELQAEVARLSERLAASERARIMGAQARLDAVDAQAKRRAALEAFAALLLPLIQSDRLREQSPDDGGSPLCFVCEWQPEHTPDCALLAAVAALKATEAMA